MDKGSGSSTSRKTKNPIVYYSREDPYDSSSKRIPVYMFCGGDRYDPTATAATLAPGFDYSNSRPFSRKGNLPRYIQQGHNFSRNFRGTRFVEHCDPTCIPRYNHEIVFYNQRDFTVDGETRDADDPKNLPLLESLNNLECPDEFDQPGLHEIVVYGKWMFEERTQEVDYHYDGPVNQRLPVQHNF